MASKINKWFWVRLIISISLIGIILSKADLNQMWELFSSTNLILFGSALFLSIFERFFQTYKWNLILKTKQLSLNFWRLFKIYYISTFISNVFFSFSGELFRVYQLQKINSKLPETFSSVFVERLIAMIALLTLGVLCTLSFLDSFSNKNVIFVFGIMLIILGGMWLAFTQKWLSDRIRRFLHAIKLGFLERKITKYSRAILEFASYKKMLLYVLFLSFIFQFLRIVCAYFVYLSMSHTSDISFFYFVIFLPAIMILVMIPISVAGLGMREGAFVYFFSSVGMPLSEAVTLSLMFYALTTISILPGGILFLKEGLTPQKIQPPEEEEKLFNE